jgi:hypothetical protein
VEVGLEQVLVAELHQAGHAVLFRVLVGFLDALRVDVDADRADSELLRRRDRDAAVARAKVVEHVALLDVGKPQHLVHHLLRRGHEDDVGCLVAARLRLGNVKGGLRF